MPTSSLVELISSRRVIVTVGCGGVGKTTTAAALALAAARKGRRVLCLTIDPAKRLATSLGLKEMRAEAQSIDPAIIGTAGTPGSLVAMMLDVRRTFDELVTRYASDAVVRERILKNRIYQEIAGSLAGTPEYMAMEKLHAVRDNPDYDLIILDTPPTSNALDFLDAPDRMINAVDSPAVRAFVTAFEGAGKFSLNLLSKAMAKILSGLGKFTGTGFLEQVAGLLVDLQVLFGGFRERAAAVKAQLRNPDVAFVIVTSPESLAVTEAMFFAEKLAEGGMTAQGLVINRVRRAQPVDVSSPHRVANVLQEAHINNTVDLAAAILRAHHDALIWSKRDANEVLRLKRELANIPRVVEVPAFDEDVYDVRALSNVASILVN